MKARFIFILIAFLSASCTQIYFKQPQPKGKKEIPEFPVTIRGVYSVESMDTVIVFAGGYNWIEVSLMRVALTQFNTESDVRIDNDRLFDEIIRKMAVINTRLKTIRFSIRFQRKMRLIYPIH